MAQTSETKPRSSPRPCGSPALLPPRARSVFKAWSSADHVKRWFCPDGYHRARGQGANARGGPFEVCMRAPDGDGALDARDVRRDRRAVDRLVLDLYVSDAAGRRLFRAYTEVDFIEETGGTRMDVVADLHGLRRREAA